MATRSIVTDLKSELAIANAHGSLPGVHSVFLFGSLRESAQARDVDLLVVWDDTLGATDAIAVRATIRNLIGQLSNLPLDITLLSEAEERSTRFAERVDAELIFLAPADSDMI